jgi:hypothetical protein
MGCSGLPINSCLLGCINTSISSRGITPGKGTASPGKHYCTAYFSTVFKMHLRIRDNIVITHCPIRAFLIDNCEAYLAL